MLRRNWGFQGEEVNEPLGDFWVAFQGLEELAGNSAMEIIKIRREICQQLKRVAADLWKYVSSSLHLRNF